MPFTLTLVASSQTPRLSPSHLALVQGLMDSNGIRFSGKPYWLKPNYACDLPLDDFPRPDQMAKIRAILEPHAIDAFINATETRRKSLLLADMDATILQGETLDELAAAAGVGDQVAEITTRAMRGELDFRAALSERIQLIRGLPQDIINETLARQTYNTGAKTLVATLRAHNIVCVLVSGGFTPFTSKVAQELGFHYHHGNILAMHEGVVTGHLVDPILGKEAKLQFLHDYATRLNIPLKQTAAIGDGANDLPMLQAAGLGVGYHPKPLLQERLDNLILYGDLTALLYAMGFHSDEFVQSE